MVCPQNCQTFILLFCVLVHYVHCRTREGSDVGGFLSTIHLIEADYQFAILDPDSAFGSPLGGYSRASSSRLSTLPLKLPSVVEVFADFEPLSVKISDYAGRSFSCRAHHEDELDSTAMKSGMYESTLTAPEISVTRLDEAKNTGSVLSLSLIEKTVAKIASLKGVCAHLNQGWWSYEWCFEGKIKQFHLEIQASVGMEQILAATGITSLGEFHERSIDLLTTHNLKENTFVERKPNSDKNVVLITENFVGGEICLDTGRPRETRVLLKCCPEVTAGKRRGTAMRNGAPFPVDILYIQDVTESVENVCFYTMTICTTLLCDVVSDDSLEQQKVNLGTQKVMDIENLSISNILDLTFERPGKRCIQYGAGWWVYELCPGKYIRQYHEISRLDPVSGTSSVVIDAEHILGRFDKSRNTWNDEDWKYVVNSTSTLKARSGQSMSWVPTIHGGNGAFLVHEYAWGDVCDSDDVTDSAIKAGAIGEGRIERSATVKLGCGSLIEMTVNEDTTCHYVVHVTIPALCNHPLFRAPTSKQHLVKCLPH